MGLPLPWVTAGGSVVSLWAVAVNYTAAGETEAAAGPLALHRGNPRLFRPEGGYTIHPSGALATWLGRQQVDFIIDVLCHSIEWNKREWTA